MGTPLTPHAISRLYANDTTGTYIVQIIDHKILNGVNGEHNGPARHRLVISDGQHFMQAMLGRQLNDRVDVGEIGLHAVLAIRTCIVNSIQNRKVCIILAIDAVCYPGHKLGDPEEMELLDGAPAGHDAYNKALLGFASELLVIAQIEPTRKSMLEADYAPQLMSMLSSGSEPVREKALRVCRALLDGSRTAAAATFLKAGVLPKLVALLGSAGESEQESRRIVQSCLVTMLTCEGRTQAARVLLEVGAFPLIVARLSCAAHPPLQLLGLLIEGSRDQDPDGSAKAAVTACRHNLSVRAVVSHVAARSHAFADAAFALSAIANVGAGGSIIAAGGIPVLVEQMKEAAATREACNPDVPRTLHRLILGELDPDPCAAIIEAGAIPHLVNLLEDTAQAGTALSGTGGAVEASDQCSKLMYELTVWTDDATAAQILRLLRARAFKDLSCTPSQACLAGALRQAATAALAAAQSGEDQLALSAAIEEAGIVRVDDEVSQARPQPRCR